MPSVPKCSLAQACACACLLMTRGWAWGLSGLLAQDYYKGEEMRVMVSKVESRQTNLRYNYYDVGFQKSEDPFYSAGGPLGQTKTYGEGLSKEGWVYSPYTVWLNPTDKPKCQVSAYDVPYEPAIYNRLKIMAEQNFQYKLMVDDLPSATVYRRDKSTTNSEGLPAIEYDYGIPVAHKVLKPLGPDTGEITVMNHLVLTVETHQTDNGAIRIVGFDVEASSIDWGENPCRVPEEDRQPQVYKEGAQVTYTYQVIFKQSDLLWAHRLDHYMKLGNDRVHHLQFIVACLIALSFTFFVYQILQRTLRRDLEKVARNGDALRRFNLHRTEHAYDALSITEESAQSAESDRQPSREILRDTFGFEQINWTRLGNDVFRAPSNPLLFSVLIGMGLQYSIVALCFLIVANLGIHLSVHMREYLYLLFLALSALTGSLGGWMSARLYKFYNGTKWRLHLTCTVTLVPAFALAGLSVMTVAERMELNRFGEHRKSEFDKVYLIWALFDIPNVVLGAWLGYTAEKIEAPVKISRVPRQIPSICQQPCYAQNWLTLSIGSLITAGCVISEIYYLMASLWRQQYYFMYLYLTLCLVIMGYVASTVSVVQTYTCLSAGNYRWQWRAFLLGFAVGVHIFALCAYFYFFLEENSTSAMKLQQMVWTGMMCVLTGLVAGTCSYGGSFFFVKRIYTQALESKSK